MNLPIAFEEKMKSLLGEEEYNAYLQCFDEIKALGLRVNTRKISAEDFEDRAILLTPVHGSPTDFTHDGSVYQLAKHPYYYAGLYYLQEPSAMTPADRLPVELDKVLMFA